ncbi:MAG TPA: hypothetical protein VN282_18755 [Pyrinomonadaceae bacterium]|nr:hypothetical protein [Pyrinomonadaceae bacterium]
MSFDLKPISKALRAASLVVCAAALHVPAYGSTGSVMAPKIKPDPAAPGTTVTLVLVEIQSPRCCDPCKKDRRDCIECCSPGAKPIATKSVTAGGERPRFENVPEGVYLLTLQVGGQPADSLTREPFQVKSGKTTKIGGAVEVDVTPAATHTTPTSANATPEPKP